MHTFGFRICPSEQLADEANEVGLGAVSGYRDDTATGLGLDRHEQIGCAVAFVFLVLRGWAARLHRQWFAAVGQ